MCTHSAGIPRVAALLAVFMALMQGLKVARSMNKTVHKRCCRYLPYATFFAPEMESKARVCWDGLHVRAPG